MDRQEATKKIIDRLETFTDEDLFDFINNVDSELNNDLLGKKRLHSMAADFSDFYIGRQAPEILADLLEGYDAGTGRGFDTERLYFGYDEAGCLYSTDKLDYADFITEKLVNILLDNYDNEDFFIYGLYDIFEELNR